MAIASVSSTSSPRPGVGAVDRYVHVVDKIRVSLQSGVPVYRQIVSQLSFMVETGELEPGQALPSARLLADDLQVNRNTVAHAYAKLGEIGLVEGRGRSGTYVVGPGPASDDSLARDRARRVLGTSIRECVGLGLSVHEIQSLVTSLALRAERDLLEVVFVDGDPGRAEYVAAELAARAGVKVKPLVLGGFEPGAERADLVLTTFLHLARVRTLMRRPDTEIVAIVVTPHVRTLMRIATAAMRRTVGIWCGSGEQAITVRDSLWDAGIENLELLDGVEDHDLGGVDLVVVPEGQAELPARLEQKVEVIRFGTVLDAASVRMVRDLVRDLQAVRRG